MEVEADDRANGHASSRDPTVADALARAMQAMRGAETDQGILIRLCDGAAELHPLGDAGAIDDLKRHAYSNYGLNPADIEKVASLGIERAVIERDQAKAIGWPEPHPSIDKTESSAEIMRLARLAPMDYERGREAAARRLGFRVSALDSFVKAQRAESTEVGGQGRQFEVPKPDPWSDAVDGAALLSDMTAAIRRYVALPEGTAETVAVWVVHTHCYDAFMISPRLAITSPEKGCGKTTLLDVLTCLVARPLPTSNASVGAIFRVVEITKPTLLVDEADTFLRENEELRGILNTGHRKGGSVLRCVGDDHEPRTFSTWAPLAIAAIGKLPDTLEDRSITCRMVRRKPSERVESFRAGRTEHLDILARKAMRWAADHQDALCDADPDVGELQNRVADNWRPLLAIADATGGEWPKRLREIATAAVASRAEQSVKIQLLTDIKAAFEMKGADWLTSEDLTDFLVKMEDRPWVEFKGGRPLTKAGLGRLLNPFGISSINIRVGGHVFKGYRLSAFEDDFARYTPSQIATPLQAHSRNDFSDFENATPESPVALSKPRKPNGHSDCSGVAFSQPPARMNGHGGPSEALDWDDRKPALGPPGDTLDDFE
jgi:uncharacterized protein DUF3631